MDSVEELINRRVEETVNRLVPIAVANKLDEMSKWDMSIQELVRATGTSKSTIEKFTSRFDVKRIEERCGNKRLYRYPEIRQLWDKYLHEKYVEYYKDYPRYIRAKEKGDWSLIEG
ncbi:MAG: hypothetical protein DUD32_09235 [Lactobacillus sp.]|nr:MAG: hypothetical protein DUD32_09235 [Lactobacillus sp.]